MGKYTENLMNYQRKMDVNFAADVFNYFLLGENATKGSANIIFTAVRRFNHFILKQRRHSGNI